jgi:hypothetical protein
MVRERAGIYVGGRLPIVDDRQIGTESLFSVVELACVAEIETNCVLQHINTSRWNASQPMQRFS